MGGNKGKSSTTTLNRREGHAGDLCTVAAALIWAAKDGNSIIVEQLLDNGASLSSVAAMHADVYYYSLHAHGHATLRVTPVTRDRRGAPVTSHTHSGA